MVKYSYRERAKQSLAGAYLSWRYKYKPKVQIAAAKTKIRASEARKKYEPKLKAATKSAFKAGVAYAKKKARKSKRKKRK
jgi:hypothetical protein